MAQWMMAILLGGLAPLWVGIGQTVKARIQGRQGPAVWQWYWTIAKNWRKRPRAPEWTSPVFYGAPIVSLAALLVALGEVTPTVGPLQSWPHDLLTVFYLLALERFAVGLQGLDVAGAFGGLGASRVTTLGAGIEPAFLVTVGTLFGLSGNTHVISLWSLLMPLPLGWVAWTLVAISLVMVILAETGRIPVDNPDTHLELTMMHEATILEYGGPLLALQQFAQAVKVTVVLVLASDVLAPPGGMMAPAEPFAALILGSSVMGIVESRFAKLRFFQLPAYCAAAAGLGFLAVHFAV